MFGCEGNCDCDCEFKIYFLKTLLKFECGIFRSQPLVVWVWTVAVSLSVLSSVVIPVYGFGISEPMV